jgi:hypothetical protein
MLDISDAYTRRQELNTLVLRHERLKLPHLVGLLARLRPEGNLGTGNI